MNRLLVALALAAGLVFPATGSAHVHGITPLLGLSCDVDNTVTGANQTDSTPAGAANGGPRAGPSPVARQQFAVVAPKPPSPTVSGAFPTVRGINPEIDPPHSFDLRAQHNRARPLGRS
jgi:hypothetical protein